MRKLFKYGVGILFLIHGVYWACKTIHMPMGVLAVFPSLMEIWARETDAALRLQCIQYGFYYFLELAESLCIVCSAIMCIIIGLSKRTWRFILWAGILGEAAYLLSGIVSLLHLQFENIGVYLHIFKFMLLYIPMILYALYYRKNEANAYIPISLPRMVKAVIQRIRSFAVRLQQMQQSGKIQWPEEKSTAQQDENSEEN